MEDEEIAEILQDSIITEDNLSSAASQAVETESKPHKEPTVESKKFHSSPVFRVPRAPRTKTAKSIIKSVRAAISEFWAERPQPVGLP